MIKLKGMKAMIVVEGDEDNPIIVQFNPSEYSITDGSAYLQRPRNKEDEPVVNYTGNTLSTLNVRLHFNCDEFRTVESMQKKVEGIMDTVDSLFSDEEEKPPKESEMVKTIRRITDLTKIEGEKHQPPGCVFLWGSLLFAGYVESVGVTYTMFEKSGKPLRAVVNLTMKGFDGGADKRKSPLSSPDRTKARKMTEDNSIWNLAEKEYGDVREWRRIADANDIMNPLDIPLGMVLKVPAIQDTESS